MHNRWKRMTPAIPASHSLMMTSWYIYLKLWNSNSYNLGGTPAKHCFGQLKVAWIIQGIKIGEKRSKTASVYRWHDPIGRKSLRFHIHTHKRDNKQIQQSCRIKSIPFLHTGNEQCEKQIKKIISFIIASKIIKYLKINLTKEARLVYWNLKTLLKFKKT